MATPQQTSQESSAEEFRDEIRTWLDEHREHRPDAGARLRRTVGLEPVPGRARLDLRRLARRSTAAVAWTSRSR